MVASSTSPAIGGSGGRGDSMVNGAFTRLAPQGPSPVKRATGKRMRPARGDSKSGGGETGGVAMGGV